MKTLFRVLTLAAVVTAFSALTFAQEKEPLDALYAKFRTELKSPCGDRSAAIATGKKIIELHGDDQDNEAVIKYVREKTADAEKTDPACKRAAAYNEAVKAKNWANAFTTGKAIIAADSANPGLTLDVMLDLVSIGFDRAAVEKNDTFNAETMSLAKTALDRVNAGTPSSTKKYGAFFPFNTKEDAQSWLNYIIGWQMANKNNQTKDALTYYYKAAQVGAKKNDTTIYTTIGQFYFDEASRLFEKYTADRKANNNEETDEIKALLALSRGYADRAADAFGRAYKIAAADPKLAQLKTTIGTTLSDLYKFRFNLADAKQADVDKYVAELVAKPMPDPATAVTPVVETTPATTTTTSSTSSATTTVSTTNVATTTKETPAATTVKTTTTTKTAPVKKAVAKKKGTR